MTAIKFTRRQPLARRLVDGALTVFLSVGHSYQSLRAFVWRMIECGPRAAMSLPERVMWVLLDVILTVGYFAYRAVYAIVATVVMSGCLMMGLGLLAAVGIVGLFCRSNHVSNY